MLSVLAIVSCALAGSLLQVSSVHLPHDGQQVLSQQSAEGPSLRRFAVEGEKAIERVLQAAVDLDLDVWQVTNDHVDVYLPPSEPCPESLLKYPHTDVPISLDSLRPPRATYSANWQLNSLANTTYHSTYHSLSEINQFVWEMAALYPDHVQIIPLGHTGEGREMFAMKVYDADSYPNDKRKRKGKKKNGANSKKRSFVLSGAQHAREWIATASSLYVAHALVANETDANSLTHLLRDFDFYVIPVPNPDGYEYTWDNDRLWYKNRQQLSPDSKCLGLDMNRNWGYKWKKSVQAVKSDTPNQCHHFFPGHRPFESPEVNNMANFLQTIPNFQAFVDLRSYGQMLSSPYSHSCKKAPKDAEDQVEAAMGAAQAVRRAHGISFTTGQLCSSLYRAPGNIIDWTYHDLGVKYSYAAHLRDTGTYGFALPPEWIKPVGEETASMVEYLAHFISWRG